MVDIFNIILPFGFFFSPLIGYLLDNKELHISFAILNTLNVTYSVLNAFKDFKAVHYFNFILFTLVRAYFYSAAMSYCVKM
jgi:hypothetical protein